MNDAVAQFLATGRHDELRYGTRFEDMTRAHGELEDALVDEVKRRARGRRCPRIPKDLDPTAFARAKLGPMVRGLFPAAEQETVLSMLERSVVFVTRENIERLLRNQSFPSSAWTIANLYLGVLGAELLSPEAPRLVGLSEHMTCYVSALYFHEEEPLADFVVHEAAHVFHNCKRQTIGLHHTRRREWLLDIEFVKRETFAYSCEIFSRIVEAGGRPAERLELAERFAAKNWVCAERTEPDEIADIVCDASTARNGWKVILRRCAPPKVPRGKIRASLSPVVSTPTGGP